RWGLPGGHVTADLIQALGQLWLNALRMTIIPLVFSLLVTGIASIADAARTGRLALKAVAWFGGLIVFATMYAVAAAYGLHALWRREPVGARLLPRIGWEGAEGVGAGALFSEFL